MIIDVRAYPYATQEGTIDVPDGLTKEEVQQYIENNRDKIDFGPVELDYCGTDLDIFIEEE